LYGLADFAQSSPVTRSHASPSLYFLPA
jgi:hypothetical protein